MFPLFQCKKKKWLPVCKGVAKIRGVAKGKSPGGFPRGQFLLVSPSLGWSLTCPGSLTTAVLTPDSEVRELMKMQIFSVSQLQILKCSFTSVAVIKYPDKKQLRENGVALAHSSWI